MCVCVCVRVRVHARACVCVYVRDNVRDVTDGREIGNGINFLDKIRNEVNWHGTAHHCTRV